VKKFMMVMCMFALLLAITSCQKEEVINRNAKYVFCLSKRNTTGVTINAIKSGTLDLKKLLTIRNYTYGSLYYNAGKIYTVLPDTYIDGDGNKYYKSKVVIYNLENGKTEEVLPGFSAVGLLIYDEKVFIYGNSGSDAKMLALDSNNKKLFVKGLGFERVNSACVYKEHIYFTNYTMEDSLKLWKYSLRDNTIVKKIDIGDYENGFLTCSTSNIFLGAATQESGEIIELDSELNIKKHTPIKYRISGITYGSEVLFINTMDTIKNVSRLYFLKNHVITPLKITSFSLMDEIVYQQDSKKFVGVYDNKIIWVDERTGIIEENLFKKETLLGRLSSN